MAHVLYAFDSKFSGYITSSVKIWTNLEWEIPKDIFIIEQSIGKVCEVISERAHWAHDVIATLNQRHWRWFDVAITSCARWETRSLGLERYVCSPLSGLVVIARDPAGSEVVLQRDRIRIRAGYSGPRIASLNKARVSSRVASRV